MGDLLGNEGPDALDLKCEVIDPAVPPRFAGFEAPKQHVLGVLLIVSASMVVLRLVAAPDVAADCTHSEVNPVRSDSKTVLAAL